jgi:hypothetical protein
MRAVTVPLAHGATFLSSSLPAQPYLRVSEIMSEFSGDWFLCGGWAVDAWLGRQTRDHVDVDLTVFAEDRQAIDDHLKSWPRSGWGDDGKPIEPWGGGGWHGDPQHFHFVPDEGWEYEVMLNDRDAGTWIMNRDPFLALPISQYVTELPVGLPCLVPELLLLYKSRTFIEEGPKKRAKDVPDVQLLYPTLSKAKQEWLRESIALLNPGHPWLAWL